jgi:hypothetical protein
MEEFKRSISAMNTTANVIGDSMRDGKSSEVMPKRVKAVIWLVGITAVIGFAVLDDGPSIGAGLGIMGIAGMVLFVSYLLLRDR